MNYIGQITPVEAPAERLSKALIMLGNVKYLPDAITLDPTDPEKKRRLLPPDAIFRFPRSTRREIAHGMFISSQALEEARKTDMQIFKQQSSISGPGIGQNANMLELIQKRYDALDIERLAVIFSKPQIITEMALALDRRAEEFNPLELELARRNVKLLERDLNLIESMSGHERSILEGYVKSKNNKYMGQLGLLDFALKLLSSPEFWKGVLAVIGALITLRTLRIQARQHDLNSSRAARDAESRENNLINSRQESTCEDAARAYCNAYKDAYQGSLEACIVDYCQKQKSGQEFTQFIKQPPGQPPPEKDKLTKIIMIGGLAIGGIGLLMLILRAAGVFTITDNKTEEIRLLREV
jgi:hypothetical protein